MATGQCLDRSLVMLAVLTTLIFLGCLALIFAGKLHRTITAVSGAVVMVGLGLAFGFYGEEAAIAAIDFQTIGLLLGMMVLVSLLEPTGFFTYLAIRVGRWARGDPVRLLVLLGTVTTILSLFLDNVTTVVLIAPVTVLICELLDVSPAPFLMAEALLSDTGGVGTLVGDPPNVLIGSAAGLSFQAFLTHALPVVAVVWLLAVVLLLYLFRAELAQRPADGQVIQKLDLSKALDDPIVARRVLVVLGVIVGLFFVHHLIHLSPAFIALAGAAVALVWVRPDVSKTLAQIEWSVLIFFMALFVMVGGLEAAGVFDWVAGLLTGAGRFHPVWLGLVTIWLVALLSAIIDNVPITIALIPVLQGMAENGVNVTPLWWALVFGAGFGGNGTIIGSTANIVAVSLSERTRAPITAALWSRRGLPVMVMACAVTSLLYVLFFAWFQR
ncbi:MAG: ArsB/NhaD family transporter [Chloroflexota bacterium]